MRVKHPLEKCFALKKNGECDALVDYYKPLDCEKCNFYCPKAVMEQKRAEAAMRVRIIYGKHFNYAAYMAMKGKAEE